MIGEKTMKSLKKFFVLLFTAVMIFSLFATVAFADEADKKEVTESYVNDKNEIIVVLEDGTEINTGIQPGVKIYRDEEHQLIVEREDGTKLNLGVKPEIVDADANISINPDGARFVDSLQYMWKGMLCIFIVIGVLILSIYGLNKASNAIANRKSASSDNN